jgi:Kef-type K+ transport system membrane component KefB
VSAHPASTGVILADLALILAAAYLGGRLALRVGQPAVIGEILAGIVLGPSFAGLLPGHLAARALPVGALPALRTLSQVGLVLFMFGVGYSLDAGHLTAAGRKLTAISVASMALPFALGTGFAVLYARWDPGRPRTHGMLAPALFLGAAMSVTAFPVLARIIAESPLRRTRLGAMALACAAVQDLLAWCVLAVVVAIATASGPLPLLRTAAETVVFVLVLVFAVRPGLARLFDLRRLRADGGPLVHSVLLTGLLACAAYTDVIGLQTVFGAFAFGAVVPRDRVDALAPQVPERIEQASLLLLPVFFTVTGLSVDLWRLGARGLLLVPAVIAVACVGKFLGASGAARLTGSDRRESVLFGLLMNTRGLTELVILNVGLGLGVMDQRTFTAMVVMAVVTTAMAGPLMRLVLRGPVAGPVEVPASAFSVRES